MTVPNRQVGGRAAIDARTLRTDRWWLQPVVTFAMLSAFVGYGLYITFADRDYFAEPYLSPFFSPCLARSCPASVRWQSWPISPASPALLVLIFPLGFRATCYYAPALPALVVDGGLPVTGETALRELEKAMIRLGVAVDPALPDPARYPSVSLRPDPHWVSQVGGRWAHVWKTSA